MSTYTKLAWETIDLPAVNATTYFLILDHQNITDPSQDSRILYSGVIRAGNSLKRLDEILSQYVKPHALSLTDFQSQLYQDLYTKTFYVYYTKDDWSTFTYDDITVTYDWTYILGSKGMLSNPIYNLLDKRQFYMMTVKAASDHNVTYNISIDGNTMDAFSTSGQKVITYIKDLNEITYETSTARLPYRWSYDQLASTGGLYNNGHILSVNSSSYFLVAETCYRYCIYYINSAGGWDSLLFGGKTLQKDKITRHTYKSHYQAGSAQFGTKDYLNVIKETWQLNTNIFTDEGSDKMSELIGTNIAYLHDLEDNRIVPIVITNAECEHKTWKNQERKLSSYTIEVESAQEKYRQ